MKSLSTSIRSWGARRAPAMVLMEVLVAAAILAATAIMFLSVLGDARGDLAHARNQAVAAAIASTLLQEAPSNWPRVRRSGARAGFAWRLDCRAAAEPESPRLRMIECTAIVVAPGASSPPVTLSTGWAQARGSLFQH